MKRQIKITAGILTLFNIIMISSGCSLNKKTNNATIELPLSSTEEYFSIDEKLTEYLDTKIVLATESTTKETTEIESDISVEMTDAIEESTYKELTTLNEIKQVSEIVRESENNNNKIDECLKQLFLKKKFDSNGEEIIKKTIDLLNKKYDIFYEKYKYVNPPSKTDFILNYIEKLSNIDKITFYDKNESNDLDIESKLKNYSGIYLPSNNEIIMRYYDELEIDCEKCEIFLHETIHSTQENISSRNTGIKKIMTEGESTFFVTAIQDEINNNVVYYPDYDNEDYYYCIKGISAGDYNLYSKFYAMLFTLVGYDKMEQYKEKGDLYIITEELNSKYNIDVSKFIDYMSSAVENVESDSFDDVGSLIEKIEFIYYDCMEQELNRIGFDNSFSNMMDNYFEQYQAKYIYTGGDYQQDCTDKKFNNKIERKLEL